MAAGTRCPESISSAVGHSLPLQPRAEGGQRVSAYRRRSVASLLDRTMRRRIPSELRFRLDHRRATRRRSELDDCAHRPSRTRVLLICLSGPMLVSMGIEGAPAGGVAIRGRTKNSEVGSPTTPRVQRIWPVYAGQTASVAHCATRIGPGKPRPSTGNVRAAAARPP